MSERIFFGNLLTEGGQPDADYPCGHGCLLPGRTLAAPSWVGSGTILDNCAFLAGRVDEVGLLFFESTSCLAYTEQDLPASLGELPLTYHVHLPVDLPMREPAKAADICLALLNKTAFLAEKKRVPDSAAFAREGKGAKFFPEQGQPSVLPRAVLHPPCDDPSDAAHSSRLLARFARRFTDQGGSPADLLLENVATNDLLKLEAVVREYDFSICLDLGHMLGYNQFGLLRSRHILQRAAMLHVNAPGRGKAVGAHLPLTALDGAGLRMAERVCKSIPRSAVIMMEMFDWPHIVASLPLIRAWLTP